MAGHSHWHGIRHKKALTDAKRSATFTRLGRLITLAAREGGGDPETNISLRLALERARAANMPKETIERAIKRGTGELREKEALEEVVYEAYGPGNVAMIIVVMTDNRNRAVGNLKALLGKYGGKLAGAGSVQYLFQKKGFLVASREGLSSPEEFVMDAIEAGVEDIREEEEEVLLLTPPQDVKRIHEKLTKKGYHLKNAFLGYDPLQTVSLSPEETKRYEQLLEALQEDEDVQEVYDNREEHENSRD